VPTGRVKPVFFTLLSARWLPRTAQPPRWTRPTAHAELSYIPGSRTHPRVRFLFQPTYAPWLNLIELWWKTLRSLALKGRRFEDKAELITAIDAATVYWNRRPKPYYWRKAA
jgi:transposase